MGGQQGTDVEEMRSEVELDRKSLFDAFRPYMVRGEVLLAVYDSKGGTIGLIGLSDKRLILLDRAFEGKKKAFVSVPWCRVSSVASDASGEAPFDAATLYVTAVGGRTFELQFRSSDNARRAYSSMMQRIL